VRCGRRARVVTLGIPASSQANQVSIRRVRAEDWQLVRCVRLAALADAPGAFGRTLEEELALPDSYWETSTARNALGETSCAFLAMIDDVPCGFVVGVLAAAKQAELYALWVAANVRRRGTGLALVQAVSVWARERGAERVSLKVVAANSGAVELYRRTGFELEAAAATSCGARQDPALRLHKQL
jgi:ribosomal protein S18 acetylase RimI-like enzyme